MAATRLISCPALHFSGLCCDACGRRLCRIGGSALVAGKNRRFDAGGRGRSNRLLRRTTWQRADTGQGRAVPDPGDCHRQNPRRDRRPRRHCRQSGLERSLCAGGPPLRKNSRSCLRYADHNPLVGRGCKGTVGAWLVACKSRPPNTIWSPERISCNLHQIEADPGQPSRWSCRVSSLIG